MIDDKNSPLIVAGLGQCSWDTLFMVKDYPRVDDKAEVFNITMQGGGPVATALVALRRMGIECRFAGVVGADEAGGHISHSLKNEGIDINAMVVRADESSQSAYIAVEQDTAQRTIFWQRPTGEPINPSEVSDSFLEQTSLLILDGLMPEASIHLAHRASEMGVPILLDAGRDREGMQELAAICDHLVGSEVFARDVGIDTAQPASCIDLVMERFPQGLTVTLGERGCIHYGHDGILSIPAYSVDAIDTTGAGDVFHAGYAYGVLSSFDIERTLRFASAAAALSTMKIGGRGALAGVEEVYKLMDSGI